MRSILHFYLLKNKFNSLQNWFKRTEAPKWYVNFSSFTPNFIFTCLNLQIFQTWMWGGHLYHTNISSFIFKLNFLPVWIPVDMISDYVVFNIEVELLDVGMGNCYLCLFVNPLHCKNNTIFNPGYLTLI